MSPWVSLRDESEIRVALPVLGDCVRHGAIFVEGDQGSIAVDHGIPSPEPPHAAPAHLAVYPEISPGQPPFPVKCRISFPGQSAGQPPPAESARI